METVVVNINPKERRIGLSIKRLEEDEQEGYFNDYMNSNKPAASALGEAFQRAAKCRRRPMTITMTMGTTTKDSSLS